VRYLTDLVWPGLSGAALSAAGARSSGGSAENAGDPDGIGSAD
jgi:hypothetical protein